MRLLIIFFFSILCSNCFSQSHNYNLNSDTNKSSIEKKNIYNFYILTNPNPFNQMIRFRIWGLPFKISEFFTFKIFDIKGQQVEDLTNDAKYNNIGYMIDFTVYLNELLPGVYFSELFYEKNYFYYKFMKSY